MAGSGVGVRTDFNRCYKCEKRLKFFAKSCRNCGADNSKVRIFSLIEKILALLIFLVIVSPFLILIMLLIANSGWSFIPLGFKTLAFTLNEFLMTRFVLIFPVCFGLFIILLINGYLGNFYQESLRKKVIDPAVLQARDKSLVGFAKKTFSPGQYKIIYSLALALLASIIISTFTSAIMALNLIKSAGWNILFIFIILLTDYLTPILFLGLIVVFLVFYYQSKTAQLAAPTTQPEKPLDQPKN